jgi:glycosyltransferase involved in cell wall biosynthesis
MTIVLALASPYPAPRGSQVLVEQIARGLRRRGHTVAVVSYGRWLRNRPGLHPMRPLLDVWTLLGLVRTARRLGADVIHAHNYEAGALGLVAARVVGCPLVYHGHSQMEAELPSYARSEVAGSVLRRLGRLLDRAVPRRADHVIAVTPELAATLEAAGASSVSTMVPVADPVELGRLGPPPPEATRPTVCYAGNLDGYQNLALLRDGFAALRLEVPDARLEVVTHAGAQRAGSIEGPGIRVRQAASFAEVWEALGRAWVVVTPRSEVSGFPMKLLNYMAAAKAIVTTAGSAKGLRHGVTAWVVPNDDPKAFASALVVLLRDEARRTALGRAARAAVGSPDAWEASMRQLEALYSQVIEQADRRRGRVQRPRAR